LARGDRFAPGPVHGADVLLALEGESVLHAAGASHPFPRGRAVLATSGLDYTVEGVHRAMVVRASIP
jgi:hypothetical protein